MVKFGWEPLRPVLKERVVIYGDRAYYIQFGFKPVTQETFIAPYTLQFPKSWLAQSQ